MADPQFDKNICDILNVSYKKESATKDEYQKRKWRLEILKTYQVDEKYEDIIDNIAFSQEDLYEKLDEGCTYIYLCGDTFSIPLGKGCVKYYGINNPVAVINAPYSVDLDELEIELYQVKIKEKVDKDNDRKLFAQGKDCPPHLLWALEQIWKDANKYIDIFFKENENALSGLEMDIKLPALCIDNYIVCTENFSSVTEGRNWIVNTFLDNFFKVIFSKLYGGLISQ